MRSVTVVGARPQFIKIAPVCRAIERHNATAQVAIEDHIVHTGQHYDEGMSQIFFDELKIPRPAVNLEIGSGSHGEQTGRMLIALEKTFLELSPDVVIIYGDTNSTLAGALAAAKLRIPVAHVEAGLRSFNRAMPEEINRIVSDHVSDVLYAPTATASRNLIGEGLGAKTCQSGDVMYDAVRFNRELSSGSPALARLGLRIGEYALVTIHRAESTTAEVLAGLVRMLSALSESRWPIVLPMHPRTKAVLERGDPSWRPSRRLHIIEPVGYLENLYLIEHACMVLTDSGGLQKEAYFLGAPCITLRGETEWPETVAGGGNKIAGVVPERVLRAVDEWEAARAKRALDFAANAREQFGGGQASDAIVAHLAAWYAAR
jgi:UDP-GlcNAc3NAcA epimerase